MADNIKYVSLENLQRFKENLADVAISGAAGDVSYDATGTEMLATTVQAAIQELNAAIGDSTSAGEVTCEVSTPASGEILRVYSFYQGVLATDDDAAKASKKIIDINIPKDYLVKDAEVKTVETADVPYSGAEIGDKYIDFTVNTLGLDGTETHLYIPVDDLMSAISGSVGAEITVTISDNNVISATINKVNATKIIYQEADDSDPEHPIAEQSVTAKIVEIDNTIAALDNKTEAAINALDADETQVADAANGLNLEVVQQDGLITGISGSIVTATNEDIDALFAAPSPDPEP